MSRTKQSVLSLSIYTKLLLDKSNSRFIEHICCSLDSSRYRELTVCVYLYVYESRIQLLLLPTCFDIPFPEFKVPLCFDVVYISPLRDVNRHSFLYEEVFSIFSFLLKVSVGLFSPKYNIYSFFTRSNILYNIKLIFAKRKEDV